ncbi:hypothetical protein JKP88DRAFT_220535 [Tribonema minus]|uniref:Secreted protein n=1 Tax=Tribonema minus TaxID=303371 RepID=A0A836CF61_9STRA|nr:hypothetical protein JKP88DRAFT_220535 [Tribonema minus]
MHLLLMHCTVCVCVHICLSLPVCLHCALCGGLAHGPLCLACVCAWALCGVPEGVMLQALHACRPRSVCFMKHPTRAYRGFKPSGGSPCWALWNPRPYHPPKVWYPGYLVQAPPQERIFWSNPRILKGTTGH